MIPIIIPTTAMECATPQKKTECDIDNCPGVAEDASLSCVLCEAVVHPTCFKAVIRSSQSIQMIVMMRSSAPASVAVGMVRRMLMWKLSRRSDLNLQPC